jgi:hypothetical protein
MTNIPLTPEQIELEKQKLASEDLSSFPSLFQQARNLVKQGWISGLGAVKGVALLTTPEKAAARLDICQACEFYRDERCLKCGCYMSKKAQLELAGCPMNKWGDLTTVKVTQSQLPPGGIKEMQIDLLKFPESERDEMHALARQSLLFDGRFAYKNIQYKAMLDADGRLRVDIFQQRRAVPQPGDIYTPAEREQFGQLVQQHRGTDGAVFSFKEKQFQIKFGANGNIMVSPVITSTEPATE